MSRIVCGLSFFFILTAVMSCSKGDEPSSSSAETSAGASDQKTSSLNITSGVMKAMPPGQTVGAIYLKIDNLSDKTAVLTYVHSEAAEKIEVHRHIYNDGMMQMRAVPHLTLDPKKNLEFKPGAYHLMAFGMSPAPKVGERFDVVFEFAGFPAKTLSVVVEAP